MRASRICVPSLWDDSVKQDGWRERAMEIDVNRLRDYMMDRCGTAAAVGMWPAAFDVMEIERMDPRKLCELAEKSGVDLRRFEVRR